MAVSITFGSSSSATDSSGVLSFAGMSIGTAASDRLVAVCLASQDDSVITAVTIGGVSATQRASGTDVGSSPDIQASIWVAAVPTGATADVEATLNIPSGLTWSADTFSIVGAVELPSDSDTATGSAPSISISALTIPTDGAGLCTWANNAQAAACTWTGATEASDVSGGGHRQSSAIVTTVGTNTITADGQLATQVLLGIAFEPAAVPVSLLVGRSTVQSHHIFR